MTDRTDFAGDQRPDDLFEIERRGYSRRRVDEFMARNRNQMRDMEDRLSQALDDNERLRLELSSARQAVADKPAHEEISERIGQILKLAEDEAKSQRARSDEEITRLRADAQQETDKLRTDVKAETDKTRAEAHEQAERMLSAAQEQAERTVATSQAEADKTRTDAKAEAERAVAEATRQSDGAIASAQAQAKQQLDEATARATAIHDGAERRLNLLMSRHTEAIRRLTEIRDVVTTLVAGEASRGSLEEEVARTVASVIGEGKGAPVAAGGSRPAQQAESSQGPGSRTDSGGRLAGGPQAGGPQAGGPQDAEQQDAEQQDAGQQASEQQDAGQQASEQQDAGPAPRSGRGPAAPASAGKQAESAPAGPADEGEAGTRRQNGAKQAAAVRASGTGNGQQAGSADSVPLAVGDDDTGENVRIVPE